IVTVISSFLLVLLVLMISDNWMPQLDYLENLMNTLRIQLIEIKTENREFVVTEYWYLIDVQSKYVVLLLLTTAAYGLTTYLGITPAIRPWKKLLK
ncbi:MAG: hypothetical protein WAO76_11210, partial [Georgfuchsia sp.]